MHRITFRFVAFAVALGLQGASSARAAPAGGMVLSPHGEPVAGAEVIVATAERAAWPNVAPDKRRKDQRGAAAVTSGADGRFTVELPADAGRVLVHHPKVGYAELKPADVSGEATVKLESWCRVEGVLKIGTRAAPAGTKVRLGNFSWSNTAARVHYGYATETDAEGRYVLDRVPAGLVKIDTRVSKTGAPLEQYTSATPDKPTRFDVGDTGRPVIGRVVLPAVIDLRRLNKWPGVDSQCHFRRDVPWPRNRARFEGNHDEQVREDAEREWRKTLEAVEAYRHEYRCEIDPHPDGTFRLDDVPPGKYVLSLSFHRMEEGKPHDELAAKKIEVVVPDAPASTEEPLDLGDVELGSEGL